LKGIYLSNDVLEKCATWSYGGHADCEVLRKY